MWASQKALGVTLYPDHLLQTCTLPAAPLPVHYGSHLSYCNLLCFLGQCSKAIEHEGSMLAALKIHPAMVPTVPPRSGRPPFRSIRVHPAQIGRKAILSSPEAVCKAGVGTQAASGAPYGAGAQTSVAFTHSFLPPTGLGPQHMVKPPRERCG